MDTHKVAEFAAKKGWKLPTPPSPINLLARKFTEAVRDEPKTDPKTENLYRVYHAISVKHGQLSVFVYVDIDEAPRRSSPEVSWVGSSRDWHPTRLTVAHSQPS